MTASEKLQVLERILAANNQSDPVQEHDNKSYEDISRKLAETNLKKAEAELKGITDNQDQRKSYAEKIFILICIYLSLVFVLLILDGFCCIPFKLDTEIIITILGTTTANILMMFYFVPKYLFSENRQ